jgi:hypothetical protein
MVALVTSLLALGVVAREAGAATQFASSPQVVATFSYRGTYSTSRDLRLVIRVDGVVRYDQPVSARFCGHGCWPDTSVQGRPAVHARNLGPGNHRDVELDLYSGGAHCCTVEQVFIYGAKSKKYVKAERVFGDPSAPLVDLGHDGRYEFESADDAFAYRFTDFAASGLPVEVIAFSHHRFHDVTARYPTLVAHDAHKWLTAFRANAAQHYSDSVGLAAAWAADEDLLGHTALVTRFLDQQAAAGHLNSALGTLEPNGRAFVVALDRFLRRQGYLA